MNRGLSFGRGTFQGQTRADNNSIHESLHLEHQNSATVDDLIFIQEVILNAQTDLRSKELLPRALTSLVTLSKQELKENLSVFSEEVSC
jgi:hypothetical protein